MLAVSGGSLEVKYCFTLETRYFHVSRMYQNKLINYLQFRVESTRTKNVDPDQPASLRAI